MPFITFVAADGERTEVEASAGTTVMQAAVENGVDGILGECGGSCSCATCHVHVDPAWQKKLPPPESLEQEMLLGTIEPEDTSRLGCQITLTPELDGLVLRLPSMQI